MIIVGNTTATLNNHLVDISKSFITSGVISGQIVHNIVNNTYANITNVAPTDLTLDADIFISGDVYEIKN